MALEDLAAAFNLTKNTLINGNIESDLPNEFADAGLDEQLIPISLRYCALEAALHRQESARYYLSVGITPTLVGVIFMIATNSWLRFANNLAFTLVLIGLFFMGKGMIHQLRIDQKTLDASSLPYPLSSLLTSETLITKERAKRITRRTILYWSKLYGFLTGFGTFIIVLNAAGQDPEYLFVLLAAVLAGIATSVGSLIIMLKVIEGPIDSNTPKSENKIYPGNESYSIPMSTLEEYHKSESEIASSNLVGPGAVGTAKGGPVKMNGTEGLIYFAEQGIVFLPADPDKGGSLGKETAAKSIGTFAGQVTPLLGLMSDLAKPEDAEPLSLQGFTSQSLKHPAHFTIPWRRLVKVSSDKSTNRIVLVRQEDDGSETSFFLDNGSQHAPRDLMVLRFHKEVKDAANAVKFPIMFKHHEELKPKYQEIYGDRLEDYIQSLWREANTRMTEDLQQDPTLLHRRVREELEHILPHFAEIEFLRETYPSLFL